MQLATENLKRKRSHCSQKKIIDGVGRDWQTKKFLKVINVDIQHAFQLVCVRTCIPLQPEDKDYDQSEVN